MMQFLVVDDHPLFREALQSALRVVRPDADIFEATSIEGAVDVIAAHRELDLALLDLSLPGTTGFSGLMRVRAAYPRLPVIVVSGYEEPGVVRQALALGVAGYVPKSAPREALASAIERVLAGEVYIPAEYRALAEPGAHSPEQIVLKRLQDLTPQQLTVLDMIREGKQNKQIAHELRLAETTVKAHVSEILRKLNVFTRTNAVIEVAKVDFSALRAGRGSGE